MFASSCLCINVFNILCLVHKGIFAVFLQFFLFDLLDDQSHVLSSIIIFLSLLHTICVFESDHATLSSMKTFLWVELEETHTRGLKHLKENVVSCKTKERLTFLMMLCFSHRGQLAVRVRWWSDCFFFFKGLWNLMQTNKLGLLQNSFFC